ncbi:hypothetical protein BDB00DRAFT_355503 [Zychaea mexicana]|uniref:uncharacterized protein n=1 Tax=Zychaea mexicana TaxID=64656 RepID=UPI0022FDCD57|nr:uncharacterized protein BDB00DRAFT_355503 [Zychaea mexicana]KAI9493813.1 hypothetical protein BDB00DRAFT_355503 [Zychaea mexicana]
MAQQHPTDMTTTTAIPPTQQQQQQPYEHSVRPPTCAQKANREDGTDFSNELRIQQAVAIDDNDNDPIAEQQQQQQPSESFIATSIHSDGGGGLVRSHSDEIQTSRLKSYNTLPTITTSDFTTSSIVGATTTTTANGRPSSWNYHQTSSNEPPLHIIPSWRTEPLLSSQSSSTGTGVAAAAATTTSASVRRPDLGELNIEEQEALKAEITQRRAARRVSKLKRRKTYADEEEDDDDEERVFVGTRVAEGHQNYPLMYDMLTGIRIAVGRVSAKMRRDLTPQDFTAAHKLVFDVTGNELTPGVKYDFKFKDYAPWVFRGLREKFHLDAGDYMMSLTNKYILSELNSPGKSGSFLYYSRDYRFIIKTIHHSEHKFMRKVLKDYYQHVCDNPNTLLCRYYGLHRIKLPRGRKIHFVVMGNVFPGNKDIHQTFDLKGSMFGRLTPEEVIAKNPHAVMKDQNWLSKNMNLELGPLKRMFLLTQLENDISLLQRANIMDYSLLIGIHDMNRGNTEGIRDHHLQMVQPATKGLQRQLSALGNKHESKADIVRKALKHTNPVQLNPSDLPETPSEERRYCVFYSEDGGFRSTDENNELTQRLYFMGVIDILTPYNIVKKTEHFWKSLTQDKHSISAVNPVEYGHRFMHFIKNAVTKKSDH